MRWKRPLVGTRRIRSWYAWLPVWCEPQREERWLERVTVEQLYEGNMAGGSWKNQRFLDDATDEHQVVS